MTEIVGSFTVLTGNKFGFLLDDVEDPDEILNSISKDEKPKQKTKKPKPEKAAAVKVDDSKQASKPDATQSAADTAAKKPRRERPGQQDGRSAIPRFNEPAAPGSAEAGEGQQRSGRGFGGRGGGQPRGFGSGAPRPATAPADAANAGEAGEGGRGGFISRGGRGRGGFGEGGRGGFGGGRGRGGFGEGRGGFGEGRGRGGRGGFGGMRTADSTAPATEEGGEERPATSGGGFGRGRGRGGFGGQRGGEQPVPESDGGGVEPTGDDDTAQVSGGDEARGYRGRGRGGFGGGRGPGGGRGGRGGFGPNRAGRGREFERHSGSATTGVKPVEKREGGGAHNWGTVKDDLEEQLQEGATADLGEASAAGGPSAKDQDWAEAVDAAAAAAGGEEAPAQKAMMTLEEWRKQQADDRAKLQAAKAAEAASRKVDTSGFKEMTAYRKQRLAEGEDDEEDTEPEATPAQLIVKKSEVETNFYVNVNNPQANFDEGRRRGGRGGGRGGRGRGVGGGRGAGGEGGPGPARTGPQPAARAAANFRVDDKADFPDLG